MNDINLIRHGLEFARAIDNHQYEVADTGLYFPAQRAMIGGVFDTRINGADRQIDANILPAEGLAKLLKSGMGGMSWYIAPFINNVTPQADLKASTFAGTMGEFTLYTEPTRVAYIIPADPAGGAYSNSAAPAVFTAGAVPAEGQDIYGAAILSASGKNATTGDILCCSKFSGPRKLYPGDKLTAEYIINATSTT